MCEQFGPIDDANDLVNQLFRCAPNDVLDLAPIIDVHILAHHHPLTNQLYDLHQP